MGAHSATHPSRGAAVADRCGMAEAARIFRNKDCPSYRLMRELASQGPDMWLLVGGNTLRSARALERHGYAKCSERDGLPVATATDEGREALRAFERGYIAEADYTPGLHQAVRLSIRVASVEIEYETEDEASARTVLGEMSAFMEGRHG